MPNLDDPCPFCGGEIIYNTDRIHNSTWPGWEGLRVECRCEKCRLHGCRTFSQDQIDQLLAPTPANPQES